MSLHTLEIKLLRPLDFAFDVCSDSELRCADGSLDVKLLEMTEKLMEYKGAEEALKVAQTQSEHANFVL